MPPIPRHDGYYYARPDMQSPSEQNELRELRGLADSGKLIRAAGLLADFVKGSYVRVELFGPPDGDLDIAASGLVIEEMATTFYLGGEVVLPTPSRPEY